MGIGQTIGDAALAVAADLSLAIFGIIALITVISALIILTNVGGQGLQKPIRQWFMAILFAAVLSGAATAIARGVQSLVHVA